ncbi:MAG: (d)CMP kinase [Prevotellaceae bacterium]|jgi:cytidylate kinase|nr:(d)CMP kinase [Prevotellaceae bacterium]
MRKIIIAIDGHSSTGKSTFAKAIAAKLGYVYVDTGAMYRSVTLYALQQQFINERGEVSEKEIVAHLPAINITFRYNKGKGASDTYLNGENVEQEIRSFNVSQYVSRVSAIPGVRERMVRLQQEMGVDKGIVMDGRDIGTVVFPQAELKIYMTADPQVRAERRFKEMKEKGSDVPFKEILENVKHRDYEDEHRAVAPLRKAPGALLLDNSRLTPEQQMEWFLQQLALIRTHNNS